MKSINFLRRSLIQRVRLDLNENVFLIYWMRSKCFTSYAYVPNRRHKRCFYCGFIIENTSRKTCGFNHVCRFQ